MWVGSLGSGLDARTPFFMEQRRAAREGRGRGSGGGDVCRNGSDDRCWGLMGVAGGVADEIREEEGGGGGEFGRGG